MIVLMQIWEGDKHKAVNTAKTLKDIYPNFLLGILANNCEHPKELEDYADLIHTTTEDVFRPNTGGLAAHELLELGLKMPGEVLVKIDADTEILFSEHDDKSFCGMRGVFGAMKETHAMTHRSIRCINGGALGISRAAARRFVDEKILLHDSLITLSGVNAYIRAKIEGRIAGKSVSSHDWTIAWACDELGIPMEQSDILISMFRHPVVTRATLPNARIRQALNSLESTGLRKEYFLNDIDQKKKIASFLSGIWGEDGIMVTSLSQRTFNDLDEATQHIFENRHSIVSVRPIKNNAFHLIVLHLDPEANYNESLEVSTMRIADGTYQVIMKMEPSLTEDDARALIDMAKFTNTNKSIYATTQCGCRVPSTASFARECVYYHDGTCNAYAKIDGEIELIKNVDVYFSFDEAKDVILQLSKSCKEPILAIKEELVLL